MTKQRSVRIVMMPNLYDDDLEDCSCTTTVLIGLPRTIRRQELRRTVPLAEDEGFSTTRDILKSGAPLIVTIVAILSIGTANADSCADEITKFQNALPRDENGEPTLVGTAPQSIGAELEHQPTPISVECAKKDAQSQIFRALAQAQSLDSKGGPSECREAIAAEPG